MKKTLLYICTEYCVANRFMHPYAVGIQKKIDIQKRCFESAGYEVQYGIIDNLPQNIFPKLTDINLFSTSMDWNKINISKPVDVVYVRFYENIVELGFLLFLRKIRQINKNAKIMFEFQTFPFDRDYYFKDRDFTYYRFRIFVELMKFYIDRIILCVPNYKRVYGIKTLYMPNGVEYKDIKIIPQNRNKDEIHMIMVSSMNNVHGIDRIIKGMATYYKQCGKRKVILHLVGKGSKENEYKKLTEDYGLMDYILFEGYCTGDKLNDLYLLADIGIYAFGLHRTSTDLVSSGLKLKEEAAYGLPIIGSGRTDMDCATCMKYILKFPSDETDIDIGKIISFYDRIYCEDKGIVRNTIKEIFRPYYDVQETLKEVLDYMEV